MSETIPDIEQALTAVGELLAAEAEHAAIVVLGGAAVNLLGIVQRATRDVDVLAVVREQRGRRELVRPDPLPEPLRRAVATVARDLELPHDWLNIQVATQWDSGLPPGLEARLHWRDFGALAVGIVDRRDLVFFKLYAAADDVGSGSVHFQDLLALRPTADELEAAAAWIGTQDPTPEHRAVVRQVVEHVRRAR